MLNSLYNRKFLSAFALIILLITNSFAQNDDVKKENEPNSLTKGSWSLQFRISDNFTLSSFQGSTISAKRHFSEKSAVRFGVDLSGYVSESENYSSNTNSDGESDDNRQSIKINTQFIYYPALNKAVNFYWGAGPFIEFSRSKKKSSTERITADTLTVRSIIENKICSWKTGILGVLGIEYFFTGRLSFLAEYGSSFYYNWSKGESTRNTNHVMKAENKKTCFGLSASSVKFGLSVYF